MGDCSMYLYPQSATFAHIVGDGHLLGQHVHVKGNLHGAPLASQYLGHMGAGACRAAFSCWES